MAMSDREFVAVCVGSKSLKEVVERTGLKESTVQQKRSKLRGEGWPIPEFTRGRTTGTNKPKAGPTEEDLKALAESMGKTVDELKELSAQTKQTVAERAAKILEGRAAAPQKGEAPQEGQTEGSV